MELKDTSIAGTMESSDIMITLVPAPSGTGIEIELNSVVEKQFGKKIRAEIEGTLRGLGIEDANVKAVDKGALDCTIRARLLSAACRSAGLPQYDWGNR